MEEYHLNSLYGSNKYLENRIKDSIIKFYFLDLYDYVLY